MAREKRDDRLNTVVKNFEIIQFLEENGGATATEVAKELDMPRSTVHRYLVTLEELEYLIKTDRIYHPSTRFLKLGDYARRHYKVFDLVKPKVQSLARQTGERAQFVVEEFGQCVYLYREIGQAAVQTDSGLGMRVPLHSTAAGKAFLAHLPKERVDEIIQQRGLSRETGQTITDRGELFEELAKIRNQGFAINDEEHIEGLRSVAVPILHSGNDIAGALSVSGPAKRMKLEKLEEELAEQLNGITNELELKLTYEETQSESNKMF